ncbi:NADH-quinone oxidoreductase subunit C [Sulfurospirillum barnesii]|uniref:NADH-quinone oxidoreductase subunit C n=1 Tax=Sulfurospirillum barnesii (strain ATCC 700032 / DSM 10660 / SES-3) TaxID=760154 RepID=I3XU61_SULBS|nr:NADH-quinone oxidoreductase subunit C [Sulfurospirillum barnesii]AFL67485.1 NADH/F420H2 dehydrogenase, subunit C [Sulfurospirillum barnesii SES-3]
MMRVYSDKKNVQKKSYYNDRYFVAPEIPKEDIESDAVFAKDVKDLETSFFIKEAYIQRGQLVIYISAKDNVKVLEFLRDKLSYNFLSEHSAIDWLAKSGEFEIFYQLLSTSKRKRVRVKCFIQEKETLKSVSSIYKSANWAEREMYDMFGVIISGHPYMKRLLMPDDWYDHPLRKTYPLQGDEVAQWYEIDKIFGKEYREIIGPEERDSARIDVDDTYRFAHIHHEVPFGAKPSQEKTQTDYQEEGGVFIVKKLKKEDAKIVKERP